MRGDGGGQADNGHGRSPPLSGAAGRLDGQMLGPPAVPVHPVFSPTAVPRPPPTAWTRADPAEQGGVELHPAVNDLVVLRTQDDWNHGSRVEGFSHGVVTIARPFSNNRLEPGEEVMVTWASPRGVAVLPTRLVEARIDGGVPVWALAVTGPAWIEQRRDFVRVHAHGQLRLRPRDEEEGATLVGELVDVSEAAIRCSLDARSAAVVGADALEVVVEFHLGRSDFTVPGQVSLCRMQRRPGGPVDVLVLFERPVGTATALRREIFAQQLRVVRPASA